MGSYKDKSKQLGMSPGKARNILFKKIVYSLAKELDKIRCAHCGFVIKQEDFSVEHLIPWLHSECPQDLYFDIANIGFSHLKCNVASARCSARVRSKTGFKGVNFDTNRKSPNKFRAMMCRRTDKLRKIIHIGWFETAEDAAKAYDSYATDNLGKRAVTNKDLGLI